MNLYDEFFKIIRSFNLAGLKYVVIGGIAMAFHDTPRFTRDVDFLIFPEDLGKVSEILIAEGYFESAQPWTFISTPLTMHRFLKIAEQDELLIDMLLANEQRHREIIDHATYADSEVGPVPIASKDDIVWLKRHRDSDQDRVNIKRLKNDED